MGLLDSDEAFINCNHLTSVTMQEGSEAIGGGAFMECSSLTDVYYGGSEAQWKAIKIDNDGNGNDPLRNATIHYNIGTIPEPFAFTGVPAGSWYAESVNWAMELDITTGKTVTTPFAMNSGEYYYGVACYDG